MIYYYRFVSSHQYEIGNIILGIWYCKCDIGNVILEMWCWEFDIRNMMLGIWW